MLFIPLIYFIFIAAYFYYKHRCFNLDIAATLILIAVSFFSILIDLDDVYGSYGINEYAVTLPTVILYCAQWTLVLLPLHFISSIKLQKHEPHKLLFLSILIAIMVISSVVMIVTSMSEIKEALIMDMVDVYRQTATLHSMGGHKESNYLMLLPQIFVAAPFPTMALFFWFYLKAFTKTPLIIRAGLLLASIVQAILSIISAGRGALIYWIFDFFLLFGYFYQYLSVRLKRGISIASLVIGGLIIGQLLIITISRFGEESGRGSEVDPLVSLYGYAGQHVNNFCAVISEGGDAPFQIGRVFPLTNKIVNHETFDLIQHYDNIHASVNIIVNVFDTFGGELYLDLGWFGYILFFLFLVFITQLIRYNWHELTFHRVFPVIVLIAFFTRSIFAWPFTGHYTTFALITVAITCLLFKYTFKI